MAKPAGAGPFTGFSRDTQRALWRLFGSDRQLVSDLEHLVRVTVQYPASSMRVDTKSMTPDIQRVRKALQVLISSVDALAPSTQAQLQASERYFDLSGTKRPNNWVRLEVIREVSAEILGRLERYRPIRRTRGRPTNIDRDHLSHGIAIVLSLSGVHVTTSRTGTFGKALALIFEDLYGDATPLDLFPIIRPASAFVNNMSGVELRQLMERTGPVLPDRSFWVRFLRVQ